MSGDGHTFLTASTGIRLRSLCCSRMCFMLQTPCSVVHITHPCYMLRVTCFMLRVQHFKLHIPFQLLLAPCCELLASCYIQIPESIFNISMFHIGNMENILYVTCMLRLYAPSSIFYGYKLPVACKIFNCSMSTIIFCWIPFFMLTHYNVFRAVKPVFLNSTIHSCYGLSTCP